MELPSAKYRLIYTIFEQTVIELMFAPQHLMFGVKRQKCKGKWFWLKCLHMPPTNVEMTETENETFK